MAGVTGGVSQDIGMGWLPHRASPATAYAARPKATPADPGTASNDRVRADRVDADGKLILRHAGKLHHIGTGRTHARTRPDARP